ncbi:MAG: hypothetical protein ACFFDT_20405 [Candidatus Hodarchaeota archaeon]
MQSYNWKKRLLSEIEKGRVIGDDIIDISHILNHLINARLMKDVMQECVLPYLESLDPRPDIIFTPEASGITLAAVLSTLSEIDMIFAKKGKPITMTLTSVLSEKISSATKGGEVSLFTRKDFLERYNHFFVIDDFLRTGVTLKGVIEMGVAAGLELSGVSIFGLKSFDPGLKYIQEQYNVEVHSVLDFDKITPKGSKSFLHIRKLCFKAVDITLELNRYNLA